jgi:phosphoglycerol transferase
VLLFPALFALMAALTHTALVAYARRWGRALLRALPALAGAAGLGALLMQFSVFSYARAQFEPDRFAQAYVDPRDVRMAPAAPRNLVLVYLESMEQTYGDTDVFERDLLASTRGLGGYSFPSFRMAAGASWTIAGMVASQCGVPLKVYTESDVRHDAPGKSFLPSASCLGDLLKARGYRNVFLGGAPLSFAGKGAFLSDHGYDEAWGREEWERAGATPDEFNQWGLYDSALFQRARKRLRELHAGGQPFNLTLLTLDTHNPFGFLSPSCRARGAADFAGIVSCASDQVAEFVRFIRLQGWLKDTVVVVIGDHLAKPNPVYEKLREVESERRIFNLFLADPLPAANTRELLAFDLFPTLAELTGLHVEGGRLGLGYAAVGALDVARPAVDVRERKWSVAALRGSEAYDALWEPLALAGGADAPHQLGGRIAVDKGQ